MERDYRYSPRVLFQVATLVLTTTVAWAGSGRAPKAPKAATQSQAVRDVSNPWLKPLPEVLKNNLTALPLEGTEARELLVRQAEEFLLFKRKRLATERRAELLAQCAIGAAYQSGVGADTSAETPTAPIAPSALPARNPFCVAMLDETSKPARGERRDREDTRGGRLRQPKVVARDIVTGKIEKVVGLSEPDLLQALKQVPDASALYKVSRALLDSETCTSTALLTALGMKLESILPDVAARTTLLKLYKRSSDCGDDLSSVRARYRLALLLIADEKHGEAELELARLVDHRDAGDYRSRSVYWRMVSAEKAGKPKVAKEMLARLRREHHMTLHGLLAGGSENAALVQFFNAQEPFVRMRSEAAPLLNDSVMAAEVLLEAQAREAAFGLLSAMFDRLDSAEPEFRLYVAVLFMRTGDTLKKFQLMTGLFKEHPALIAKSTLEMLYPLRNFEQVRVAVRQLDPFLVLSLIRQESAFNTRARSRAGAVGLMQLMPSTARRMGASSRKILYDPETNIRLGVKYFSRMVDRYGGDPKLALAAYNAGPERVDEWLKRYPGLHQLLFMDLIPFRETREYVASIARNFYWYLKLYAGEGSMPVATEATPARGKGGPDRHWASVLSISPSAAD